MKKGVISAIIVFICMVGGYYLYMTKQPVSVVCPETPKVVKFYQVDSGIARNIRSYPGKIGPVQKAELFFRVSGPVIENNLEMGQDIKKGDVLMRIDPRDYERQVEKLTHELETQKAYHEKLAKEFQRMESLLKSNAISQSGYDAARSARDASEAQLKAIETAIKIARDNLEDTVLKAPFNGSVTKSWIETYEMAKAYVPVVLLQDLYHLEIAVAVPERNIPDIGIEGWQKIRGKKFPVSFPSRGNRRFDAVLQEFSPDADQSSMTYTLILRMKQPDDFLLLPGMTAEVHELPGLQKHALSLTKIPYSAAINRHGDRAAVWLIDPKDFKISLRDIVIEESDEADYLKISSGLTCGEWIVAAGGDWLKEGITVKPMNAETAK